MAVAANKYSRKEVNMENWYNLGVDETLQKTGSDKRGLSSAEAAGRLAKYGKNSISEGKKNSWLALFLMQFTDLMTLLLLIQSL